MLSATLRQLERDGLVERHVYARVPARGRVRAVARRARTLLVALTPLAGWGIEHARRRSLAARAAVTTACRQWRAEPQELQARTQSTPRIV